MLHRYTAILGLGSNVGLSAQILRNAWEALRKEPEVDPRRLSSPYRSQPVGMVSSHWFVNAVGIVSTTLSPADFLHTLQAVESRFGRRRNPEVTGYQDRTLDLDLLLYDDIVLETPELILPHPRMEQRRFVLEPLLELTAEIVFSPFPVPLDQWARACLSEMSGQQVERCTWENIDPR